MALQQDADDRGWPVSGEYQWLRHGYVWPVAGREGAGSSGGYLDHRCPSRWLRLRAWDEGLLVSYGDYPDTVTK
ncbi:hypothetical protein ACP70R_033508 [Stipagrostis hirtigluma subsp. patula]